MNYWFHKCRGHHGVMTSGLNTRPTDEELAVEFRWTLHTRWGVGGFNGYEGEGDDFTCMCDLCRKNRRTAWEKKQG